MRPTNILCKHQTCTYIHIISPAPCRTTQEEDEVGNTGNDKLSQPPAHAPSKAKCQGSPESRKSAGVWQLWPRPLGVTSKNRVIKGSALGKHKIQHGMQGGSKEDGRLINLHTFENRLHRNFTKISQTQQISKVNMYALAINVCVHGSSAQGF